MECLESRLDSHRASAFIAAVVGIVVELTLLTDRQSIVRFFLTYVDETGGSGSGKSTGGIGGLL